MSQLLDEQKLWMSSVVFLALIAVGDGLDGAGSAAEIKLAILSS